MLLRLLRLASPWIPRIGVQGRLIDWAINWIDDVLDSVGEVRIDTESLRPGDRLEVIARPAPSKRERDLARRLDAEKDRLAKASKASPKLVATAQRLARTQRRLARSKPGSARSARLRDREERLLVDFDRRDRSAEARRATEAEVERLTDELEGERRRALTAVGRRSPKRRTLYHADHD